MPAGEKATTLQGMFAKLVRKEPCASMLESIKSMFGPEGEIASDKNDFMEKDDTNFPNIVCDMNTAYRNSNIVVVTTSIDSANEEDDIAVAGKWGENHTTKYAGYSSP